MEVYVKLTSDMVVILNGAPRYENIAQAFDFALFAFCLITKARKCKLD